MTARVEPIALSIEGIDFKPECGFKHEPAAPAEFWASAHGCEEKLLCGKHMARLIQLAKKHMAAHGHIECQRCDTRFYSPKAYMTWVEL